MFKKSTAEKEGKIWWLVARWGGWGVPLMQVALGGFWVVLGGFCWLSITSDGFVVTPISQYNKS